MDRSVADRELSKNTLDNHPTTAKSLSHSHKLGRARALEMLQSQGLREIKHKTGWRGFTATDPALYATVTNDNTPVRLHTGRRRSPYLNFG